MAGIVELDTRQYSGATPIGTFGDQLLKYGVQLQEQDRLAAAEKARLEQQKFSNTLALAAEERAKAQAARQENEYQTGKVEKAATGEAMRALLNPTKYTGQKMAGEEAAIQASLANLSPEERAATEKVLATQYNKDASSKGWLDTALTNANADQSKILGAEADMLSIALKDPNSAEYKASVEADKELYSWKQGLEHKNRLAQIAAGREGKEAKTTEFYKKNTDGSITTIKVPNTEEAWRSAKTSGFEMGTWSKGTAGEKETPEKYSYTDKDIDTTLSKIDKWNILSGDKDSAIEDVETVKKTLLSETIQNSNGVEVPKFTKAQINSIIGSALNRAIDDDNYDSSLFKDLAIGAVEDTKKQKKEQEKAKVLPTLETTKPKILDYKPYYDSRFDNMID